MQRSTHTCLLYLVFRALDSLQRSQSRITEAWSHTWESIQSPCRQLELFVPFLDLSIHVRVCPLAQLSFRHACPSSASQRQSQLHRAKCSCLRLQNLQKERNKGNLYYLGNHRAVNIGKAIDVSVCFICYSVTAQVYTEIPPAGIRSLVWRNRHEHLRHNSSSCWTKKIVKKYNILSFWNSRESARVLGVQGSFAKGCYNFHSFFQKSPKSLFPARNQLIPFLSGSLPWSENLCNYSHFSQCWWKLFALFFFNIVKKLILCSFIISLFSWIVFTDRDAPFQTALPFPQLNFLPESRTWSI